MLGRCAAFGCQRAGGLDADLCGICPHDAGEFGLHRCGVWTDFRAFADDGYVAVAQGPAVLCRKFDGVGQKDVAGRTLPLRIAGREMAADIAKGKRAVDRIGQGVHADIGIGMAQQRLAMRNLYPTQPDVIPVRKGVDVIAIAQSDIHASPFQDRLGPREILRVGQFQIVLVALDDGHRQARTPRHLDIIRRIKDDFGMPTAAYNVSGEYAMVKAMDQLGWGDGKALMLEMLLSIKRAGADMILTYFAAEAVDPEKIGVILGNQ